jgi:hypothetical protein
MIHMGLRSESSESEDLEDLQRPDDVVRGVQDLNSFEKLDFFVLKAEHHLETVGRGSASF